MNIEVKFYDWKTPFNGIPVSTINPEFEKMFGRDAQIALVYRDGKFTGIAEPCAGTIEEALTHYTEFFKERDHEAAAAQAYANEPSAEERIAAALEFQNLMSI